jgi:hypothetical protein
MSTKPGPKKSGALLENKVPTFDKERHQQDEHQVPFGSIGQVPILPGEQPTFCPVLQGQPQKQNDETKQQAGLNHLVDGKREKKVRDILAKDRFGNTGTGSKNIKQKHFPVPVHGDCDQYRQSKRKRDRECQRPHAKPAIQFGVWRKTVMVPGGRAGRIPQNPGSHVQIEKKEAQENQSHYDKYGITVQQSFPEIKFVAYRIVPPDVHELVQRVDDQQNDNGGQQGKYDPYYVFASLWG